MPPSLWILVGVAVLAAVLKLALSSRVTRAVGSPAVARAARCAARCVRRVRGARRARRAADVPDGVAIDLGADALIGEDLEQDRVAHATVDDVHLVDAAAERLQAALDLGDHPRGDDTALDQVLGFAGA